MIDDYTIKFDLEFPSSQFIGQMTGLIMPKHVLGKLPVDKVDDDPYWLGLQAGALLGSGPYMIADRKPDQFDELNANPDYYFGKPLIDRVFVFLIKSSDARAIAMQRNEVHALRRGGVSMDSIEVLLADPRFQIAATQGGQTGFSFNSRTPWLKDPRIRQAWMLAFDRKKICDVFNRGLCVFHNTNLNQPPGVYTQEMVDRYPIKGDPAKAKTLLAEAGWDSSREVSCKSPTADAARRAQYAAEQAMLADVGIKVKFEEMETPIWAAVYYENYNYDCVRVGGWGNRPTSMHYYFHSAATDAMGYSSPELDAMIDEAPRGADYGGPGDARPEDEQAVHRGPADNPALLGRTDDRLERRPVHPRMGQASAAQVARRGPGYPQLSRWTVHLPLGAVGVGAIGKRR